MHPSKTSAAFILACLCASTTVRAQQHEADSARVAWLDTNGIAVERPYVVLYFPPDFLGEEAMNRIADDINLGE